MDDPFGLQLLAPAAWVAFTPIAVAVGNRQRREGGGSALRLLATAASVSALACAPLVSATALDLAGAGSARAWALAGAMAVASFLLVVRWLLPPVRFVRGKAALPLLDDAATRARIDALARAMGLPSPRARVLNTTGGPLAVQAFAGGLPAPSLVVTDGALHRLESHERDAVLAHELGHVATGSLWLMAAVPPLAWALCLPVCTALTPLAAVAFGLLALVGAARVVGRHVEVACDLRAARAVGHAAMIGAVHKIHAAHALPRTGLLQALAHATSTHPALATRRHALWRAAPDRDALAVDHEGARRAGALARSAAAAWVAALVLIGVLGRPDVAPSVATGVGVLATSAPALFMVLALRSAARGRAARLGRARVPGRRIVLLGLLVVLVGLGTIGATTERDLHPLLGVGVLAAGGVLLVGGSVPANRRQRLRQEVAIALHQRDWVGAVARARAHPGVLARDAALRHDVALALALGGQRAEARAELEALASGASPLPLGAMSLAVLLEPIDPPAALAAAERAVALLPGDAGALGLLARALRRGGRTVEAAIALGRALAHDPDAGVLHAIDAAIALDAGEVDRARVALARAFEASPGDAFATLVRAELAVRSGAPDAREAVARAVEAARAQPFAMLDDAARALEARLER